MEFYKNSFFEYINLLLYSKEHFSENNDFKVEIN